MKTRFCLLVLIALSLLTFSEVHNASAQASTTTLKIPEIVAKVNGVDIQAKYISFRLNQIVKNVKRPLTLREKTSVVKDLIEKEIVRELVHQQGEKNELKIDAELIEKELQELSDSGEASDERFDLVVADQGINAVELVRQGLLTLEQ